MNQTAEGSGASFMEKVSAFIVDKRSLIFLITIILLIFSPSRATGSRSRATSPTTCRRIPKQSRR